MKHSSTFLLASLTALALAACGPKRSDTTTGGAETGATGTTGAASDTTSHTGTMSDTTHVPTDSTAK